MALKMPSIRFSDTWVGIVALAAISLVLRTIKIGVLPQGLSDGETSLLAAITRNPSWSPDVAMSPLFAGTLWLWTRLTGLDVALIRLLPALLGTLAVIATWLWLRSWFGTSVAWIAALLMAASPWALTLSRNISAASLVMLLMPLLLWSVTEAIRRGTAASVSLVAIIAFACLASGPSGLLALLAAGICGLVTGKSRPNASPSPIAARRRNAASALLVVIPAVFLTAVAIPSFASKFGITQPVSFTGIPGYLDSALKAVGMFHIAGDPSYVHNLGGAPLLNIFTGLMMVAGLIYAGSHFKNLRFRRLLVVFVVGIVPVAFAPGAAPNAAWAVLALPATMALAGLGTHYLLSVWFSTFPSNSAARLAGRVAVGALVALSAVQGYTQYFHAWGGSTETYSAYRSSAVEAARYAAKPIAGVRDIIVTTPEEQATVRLLVQNNAPYITPSQISPTTGTGKLRFIISPAAVPAASARFQDSYPGSRLQPHTSPATGSELIYTYEVSK